MAREQRKPAAILPPTVSANPLSSIMDALGKISKRLDALVVS